MLGIDLGGSGVKAGMVDVEKGPLAGERLRIPTPVPGPAKFRFGFQP